MKVRLLVILLIAPALYAGETIALFNGKDLSGWKPDVPAADKDPEVKPSFIVRDGKLVSLGEPRGQLVTESEFQDYRLVAEYRFPGKPGNSGILVHTSKLRARGNMHPQSIEVQLMHENAGDFWCIEENIEVPDMEKRRPLEEGQQWGGGMRDARHIFNLTDHSEKPLGEWNSIEVTCKSDEVIVKVNGELVNHGSKATAQKGKIALQAEGSEVEFRKIELTTLE